MLVLDTHVWVWLVGGDSRIGPAVLENLEAAAASGGFVVPAIAVWEVAMLAERGRLTFAQPIGQWVDQALAAPEFTLAELSPAIAISSAGIPRRALSDPSDRMIAATALELGAPLATRDREVIAFGRHSGLEVLSV